LGGGLLDPNEIGEGELELLDREFAAQGIE
jgi:hypothetical protein